MFFATALVTLTTMMSCVVHAAPTAAVHATNSTLSRDRRQATIDSVTMRHILYNAVPGRDFPVFDQPPLTSFRCAPSHGVLPKGGYYADMEAGCASFHVCANGYDFPMMCPKQTLFNQRTLTCDWFFEVNCPSARDFYAISNRDIFAYAQPPPQFYPADSIVSAAPQGDTLPLAAADSTTRQQQLMQQPTSMLVLADQTPNRKKAQALVVLFVPTTCVDTSNAVNLVQPAEQVASQPLQLSDTLQNKRPIATSAIRSDFSGSADAVRPVSIQTFADPTQQTRQQQQVVRFQQRQQDPIQTIQQQQQQEVRPSVDPEAMKKFIQTHQQLRDNRPLTEMGPQQQHQPVVARQIVQQQPEIVQQDTVRSSQARQFEFPQVQQQQAVARQQQQPLQEPLIDQQQQQIPLPQQQQIPPQQSMLPAQAGLAGGLGGPGTMLGMMLDGISQPGGVFSVLGQLLNTGPQIISSVLPIGVPMQTLIVPQNMAIHQPSLAVLNSALC